jgi:hypothetical protein
MLSVAEYYARYQQEGRAWLPRVGTHERHWLVRLCATVRQREAYAHCFAQSTTLHLYSPDTSVASTIRIGLGPEVHSLNMEDWARRAANDAQAEHFRSNA